jgi:hypothetical protein
MGAHLGHISNVLSMTRKCGRNPRGGFIEIADSLPRGLKLRLPVARTIDRPRQALIPNLDRFDARTRRDVSRLFIYLSGHLEVNRNIGRLQILEHVSAAKDGWHFESIQLTWLQHATSGPEIRYEAWDKVVHKNPGSDRTSRNSSKLSATLSRVPGPTERR